MGCVGSSQQLRPAQFRCSQPLVKTRSSGHGGVEPGRSVTSFSYTFFYMRPSSVWMNSTSARVCSNAPEQPWNQTQAHRNLHSTPTVRKSKQRWDGGLLCTNLRTVESRRIPRLTSPDEPGSLKRTGGVYLFGYQEVVAQSFSGADGPQEEDKDQIQEPPVGPQQPRDTVLPAAAHSR